MILFYLDESNLLLFFFVTGVPQTLTPYCGCSFCDYFVSLIHYAPRLQRRLSVCVVCRCVNVCICIFSRLYILFFLFLFSLYSPFSSPRTIDPKGSNLEVFFVRIYGDQSSSSSKFWEVTFCSRKKGDDIKHVNK